VARRPQPLTTPREPREPHRTARLGRPARPPPRGRPAAPARPVRRRPGALRALPRTVGDVLVDYSKHRVDDETSRCSSTSPARPRCRRTSRRCARREDQPHRGPRRAAHRAALPGRRADPSSTGRRDARGPRGARTHARLRRRRPRRHAPRPPAAARSPTWSTSASAAATSAPRWSPRRWRPTSTSACAATSCPTSTRATSATLAPLDPRHDALPGREQDLHHAGDDGERRQARAWLLVERTTLTRRRASPVRSTSSRSAPTLEAVEAFGIAPSDVPLLGLGRRALLAVERDRAADHARDRPRALRRAAARRARGRPAPARRAARAQRAGAARAARGLVPQLLGRRQPRDPPLRPPPRALRGYFQQADMESNGKSRRPRGPSRRRAPARSSGASPAPTASTPSTSCCTRARGWCRATSWRPPGRTRRSAITTRSCCRTSSRRARRSCAAAPPTRRAPSSRRRPRDGERLELLTAATHLRGQPAPTAPSSTRSSRPRYAGHADRPVRAQDLRPGRDLERELVRPDGRGARQGAREGHAARTAQRRARRGHDASTNGLINATSSCAAEPRAAVSGMRLPADAATRRRPRRASAAQRDGAAGPTPATAAAGHRNAKLAISAGARPSHACTAPKPM
jgi:hypothetical protein